MKWYRDKKFIIGNISVPVGAAIFTSLVTVGVAIVGWLYFAHADPNSQTIVSTTGITTQGQTGNNIINNVIQQHSFSETQRIIMAPSFLGGNMLLNLDNIATLTAWPPPTRDRVTLMLDFIATPVVMKGLSESKDGCDNFHGSNLFKLVTSRGPTYSFDAKHVRQEIPVEGRTFTVTLKEINNIEIQGVADPFELVFGISEKKE
jgi:hypothetical protein